MSILFFLCKQSFRRLKQNTRNEASSSHRIIEALIDAFLMSANLIQTTGIIFLNGALYELFRTPYISFLKGIGGSNSGIFIIFTRMGFSLRKKSYHPIRVHFFTVEHKVQQKTPPHSSYPNKSCYTSLFLTQQMHLFYKLRARCQHLN